MNALTRNSVNAASPSADPHADRRLAPRYPVTDGTSCPFVLPVVDDVGPARIKDISAEGIGLILNQAVDRGAILAVGLMNQSKNFCKTVILHVVHCTPAVNGSYQVGGMFLTPLTYDELKVFLM